MNAPASDSSSATETNASAVESSGISPDAQTTLTYRQITECQIRGGLEALDNAIEEILSERKEAEVAGKKPVDALTLIRQQRAAYLTHLAIERAAAKTGWS